MFVFCKNEAEAMGIFQRYNNVGAYALNPKMSGVQVGDATIPYAHMNFLPDDDVVNSVMVTKGDKQKVSKKKLKKITKKAIKKMVYPKRKTDDYAAVATGIGMAMLVTQLTSGRKSKKGPPVIVMILDENDPNKSEVVKKYLNALLDVFGLKGLDYKDVAKLFQFRDKDIKKALPKKVYKRYVKQYEEMQRGEREPGAYELVKPKKKSKKAKRAARKQNAKYLAKIRRIGSWRFIADKVRDFEDTKKSGSTLSRNGEQLKRALVTFYGVEIRQFSMSLIPIDELGRKQIDVCAEALYKAYTNDNAKNLPDRIAEQMGLVRTDYSKKKPKKLKKPRKGKNVKAVEAYKSLVKILKGMENCPWNAKKMPKVEYGYYHKKATKAQKKIGEPGPLKGPKTNRKKFLSFFTKRSNRELLVLLYTHTAMCLMGCMPGTDLYCEQLKDCCKKIPVQGLSKEFLASAKAYGITKGYIDEPEENA